MNSVRQAGRIRRGTMKPSRTTVFKSEDVKAVRASLGTSQSEFALMIGVSVATIQNWERNNAGTWQILAFNSDAGGYDTVRSRSRRTGLGSRCSFTTA
jgi:DNA-binding XRE family transcriptional regulator